jgi:AcrR family transcriptional regulator
VPRPSSPRLEIVIEGLRERKRADNRSATIDAAFELFGERGYDQVTVADICAAADIARRTFFRYFESKEAVLDEPTQRMTERVVASIAAAPASADDGQVLRAAIAESALYVLAHRAQLTLHHKIVATSDTLGLSPFRQLTEQERSLAEQLEERRGGTGEPGWPTKLLVSRAVVVLRVWLDETLRASAPADPSSLLDEMFDADPWFAS